MQRPNLRPLGVGEIVDVSIKLYLRNAAALIKIVAIVVVPVSIISALILLSVLPSAEQFADPATVTPEATQAALGDFLRGALLAALLSGLGTLIATGAAFKAVGDAFLGGNPSAGESFRFVGQRFLSLVWLSVLTVVIIGVGFLLLFIPGIYLMVSLSVVIPVLLVEDLRGGKTLHRSRELVKGRWWPVAGTLFLGIFLIPFIVQAIIGFIGNFAVLADNTSATTEVVVGSIESTIASVITTPLQAAIITVLYFDLRVRKEAFDLQLLAQSIGSSPAGVPGPPGGTDRFTPPPPPPPMGPPSFGG